MNFKKLNKKMYAAIIIAALVIGGAFAWFYIQNQADLSRVENVVRAVGRHYVLPSSEEPAIATVTDKSKVISEFLRAAENGDKLLIYKDAKKVILYRPSIDRIVEVGPVSLAQAPEGSE